MRYMMFLIGLIYFILHNAEAETKPSEQAGRYGVVSCRDKIEEVAKFIVKESNYTSMSTSNKKNPNDRLFNSQVAIDDSGVAVMNVTPSKLGLCDVSYTRVIYFSQSCMALRESTLKEWKFAGEQGSVIFLSSDGPDAMLMPAKSGCVMVKTEVAY